MTKQAALAKLSTVDALELRVHILEIAHTEMRDRVYRHRVGRDVYQWEAFRLNGCAGGYVIATFKGFTNGKPQIIATGRIDDLYRDIDPMREYGAPEALTAFINARSVAQEVR